MATERAEHRSNTPLFPLAPASVEMSRGALMYLDKTRPLEVKRHVVSVLNRAPSSMRLFLEVMAAQLPDYSFSGNLYRYGTTIAMDAIYIERLNLSAPPIFVLPTDIRSYRVFRDRIAQTNWHDSTSKELRELILSLNGILERSDPSFAPTMDAIIESEFKRKTGRQMFQAKVGFLLGLSDGYFPFRYAHDREELANDLDE